MDAALEKPSVADARQFKTAFLTDAPAMLNEAVLNRSRTAFLPEDAITDIDAEAKRMSPLINPQAADIIFMDAAAILSTVMVLAAVPTAPITAEQIAMIMPCLTAVATEEINAAAFLKG